jgi:hypothetical protein
MRRAQRNRTAAYLVTDVAAREQSHRRAVLIGIATLILLSTAPVFGHRLAVGADSLLAGRDHLGAVTVDSDEGVGQCRRHVSLYEAIRREGPPRARL